MTKFPLIFYLFIPILAILACNAPIDKLQPAIETIERPTIGPPPTLTPISLRESDFVIVTAIVFPTDTPTPVESYTPTATPTSIPNTATHQPVLPTITLDPELEGDSRLTPTITPESYPPIRLFTYYEWGSFEANNGEAENEETSSEEDSEETEVEDSTAQDNQEVSFVEDETPIYQEFYEGRLVLVGRGGAGVFAYYVGGERISGAIYPLSVENCSSETFKITVQSLNSDPLDQEVIVKAPCLATPEPDD